MTSDGIKLKIGQIAYWLGVYTITIKKLRPLAEAEVAEAQCYLGLAYLKKQDLGLAHGWLKIATCRGNMRAKKEFALLKKNLTSAQKEERDDLLFKYLSERL